ncbi:Tetraacyldisaccharide 4'-kinase [hydrothermal vent metagenome]|uniref:tetraacyldisaccharide 4'-kinase n=1 Tax=hydrothermal vent metagenome TaxID=652676 RepID=A0A3B0X871_9ZZZZ
MKSLQHYWYQSGFLATFFSWSLLPLSFLYCVVTFIRRKLYQLKFKKSYSANVPVVVIGNIVAGGSGKTPLLIAICEFIKNNGFKAGVVSRGYGSNVVGVKQVQANDSAAQAGDEPLMIYQRTGVPVVISADRVAAVDYLLKKNQCDIVLSDDGLQHYRMQRNIEIAVIDASRGFGNGFCLPAGPLRERVSRLNDVDIIAYNGVTEQARSEATEIRSYALRIIDVYHLSDGRHVALSSFSNKCIHAVAGIGNPSRFFTQLKKNGIELIEHAFSDHHRYTQADFLTWGNDCIVMTEKDAVKCNHLSLPDAWVISVTAELSKSLELELSEKILPLLRGS